MKKGQTLAEVCKQLDLQPYVLRYWLTEFPRLRGDASDSSRRVFNAEEVAVLARIKNLLYDEGYTIAGARKKLDSEPAAEAARPRPAKPRRRRSGKTQGADSDASATAEHGTEGPESLDTPDDERIETLRRGLAAALDEARSLLELLQARR